MPKTFPMLSILLSLGLLTPLPLAAAPPNTQAFIDTAGLVAQGPPPLPPRHWLAPPHHRHGPPPPHWRHRHGPPSPPPPPHLHHRHGPPPPPPPPPPPYWRRRYGPPPPPPVHRHY
ncbi:MAG: hypothetical protein IJU79_05250 [Desulfovibrionaceae bacterium]|nr:hypothetical protein [Desulfovibrionaceae bacterium]